MPTAPNPAKRPYTVSSPHGDRVDEYYWMRDDSREDPEVLAHLRDENRYLEEVLEAMAPLRRELYDELVARIPKDDSGPPVFERGYWYQTRYEGALEYPIHARRRATMEAREQVVIDENELAEGHEFFSLGAFDISENNRLLVYAQDVVGRGQYEVRVLDLDTRQQLIEPIANTTGNVVWGTDDKTFYYVEKDPVTLRGVRVWRRALGGEAKSALVFEESDPSFYLGLGLSGDRRYVLLTLSSTTSDEVRAALAEDGSASMEVVIAREPNHEFDVDHIDDRWVIRTNWEAENFRLMCVADETVADRATWTELVAHRDDTLLADFAVFNDFFVVAQRADAVRRLRIRSWDGTHDSPVDVGEDVHTAWLGSNPHQDTQWLRFGYTSLTTPYTICKQNVFTGERVVLKRQDVAGGYDPSHYVSSRHYATAHDGARVPISIVRRRDTPLDGSAPAYLYGYGAYGSSTDPEFSRSMLSLLDRGFVYALAHVRGGHELGRRWYLEGRQAAKQNSFSDFNACAEALVADGLVDPTRIVASGGSAGGLLVTAATNLRPGLFRAVVADVPFVDVVTTMLDESIPLTTNEYDEWGNPNEAEAYHRMLSYSPYDNIQRTAYPAMLVTTGLWDSQVQYFEPAKYVARLRDQSTGAQPVLLHVDLDSGHGGASGRFKAQRERALEFTFICWALELDP